MRKVNTMIVGTAVLLTLLGNTARAQETELPFTWSGKGQVSFIAEYGINEFNFDFELAVDASGNVQGKTTSSEGSSVIKHMFYGDRINHALPGYYSRKAILVLTINEQGSDPMLLVLDGRLLGGRFYTGEVLVKRYEPGTDTDRTLGIGNTIATSIDEDYLPSNLKAALKKTMPVGTVKIEGAYRNR